MAKLSSAKDRQKSIDVNAKSGGEIIRIEDGHNWIALFFEDYIQGFIHWIKIGDKTYRRPCEAGLDGEGWAPDDCEYCALALEQYELKKLAKEEGDTALEKSYNEKGYKLKANYAAIFKAVKMGTVLKSGVNKTTKRPMKRYLPDLEKLQVGKLSLTDAQLKTLFKLVEVNEETGDFPYSFIESGKDLENRPMDFKKIKDKDSNKTYTEVKEIIPSKKVLEFDIDEKDIPDTANEFDIIDDAEKIVALYKGESEIEDEGEYEEQELDNTATGKGKGKGKTKELSTADAEILDDDEIPF